MGRVVSVQGYLKFVSMCVCVFSNLAFLVFCSALLLGVSVWMCVEMEGME